MKIKDFIFSAIENIIDVIKFAFFIIVALLVLASLFLGKPKGDYKNSYTEVRGTLKEITYDEGRSFYRPILSKIFGINHMYDDYIIRLNEYPGKFEVDCSDIEEEDIQKILLPSDKVIMHISVADVKDIKDSSDFNSRIYSFTVNGKQYLAFKDAVYYEHRHYYIGLIIIIVVVLGIATVVILNRLNII